MALELDDPEVNMVVELMDVASAMLAIEPAEQDFGKMMKATKVVDKLRSHMAKVSADPVCTLGNAVRHCAYWKSKVDTFVGITSAYSMHTEELAQVQSCMQKASRGQASLNDISGAIKSIGYLQDEIKEGLTDYAEKVKSDVKSVVDGLLSSLESGGFKDSKQSLQEVLMEASLVWPLEKGFEAATQRMAELLARETGQQKLSDFTASFGELGKHVGEASEGPLKEMLEDVRVKALAARGLELDPSGRQLFESAMPPTLEEGWSCLTQSLDVCKSILYVLESVDEWASDAQKKEIRGLRSTANVRASLEKCLSEEAFDTRLQSEDDPDGMLGDLLRNIGWAEKDVGDVSAPLQTVMQQSLEEAKRMADQSSIKRKQHVTKDLHDAVKKSEPYAGGGPQGKAWTDGLAPDCSWEQLVTKAEQSILQMSSETLTSMEQTLSQASAMRECRHIHYLKWLSWFALWGNSL